MSGNPYNIAKKYYCNDTVKKNKLFRDTLDENAELSALLAELDAEFCVHSLKFSVRDKNYCDVNIELKHVVGSLRIIVKNGMKIFGNGFTHLRYLKYQGNFDCSGGTIKYLDSEEEIDAEYEYRVDKLVPGKKMLIRTQNIHMQGPDIFVNYFHYRGVAPQYPQNVKTYVCLSAKLAEALELCPRRLMIKDKLEDEHFELLYNCNVESINIPTPHSSAQLVRLLDNTRICKLTVYCSDDFIPDLDVYTHITKFQWYYIKSIVEGYTIDNRGKVKPKILRKRKLSQCREITARNRNLRLQQVKSARNI